MVELSSNTLVITIHVNEFKFIQEISQKWIWKQTKKNFNQVLFIRETPITEGHRDVECKRYKKIQQALIK